MLVMDSLGRLGREHGRAIGTICVRGGRRVLVLLALVALGGKLENDVIDLVCEAELFFCFCGRRTL